MDSPYTAEVKTAALPVPSWLERFHRPRELADACAGCPSHGRIWSCPPDVPAADALFAPYGTVHVVGLKLTWSPEIRARAAESREQAEELRRALYDPAAAALSASLLELERAVPGSWSVAARQCWRCARCARLDGLPCREPDRMRYSFSGLRFDLSSMARELLDVGLLWAARGFPSYNMALAAFLER